tara:strand:- start:253 stop:669 length:417 start_codon:yes stop_codon:yes gene_type:complete
MDLKIINKKEDPLLSRTKIESEIVCEKATPSRADVKSKLAKDLGKDEKLIVVKNIYTLYGLKKSKSLSYVYENEEALKSIEVEKKKKTEKEGEDKAAEEKPKEHAKEEVKKEKPQEVKGEEKQKEEKPQEKKETTKDR